MVLSQQSHVCSPAPQMDPSSVVLVGQRVEIVNLFNHERVAV